MLRCAPKGMKIYDNRYNTKYLTSFLLYNIFQGKFHLVCVSLFNSDFYLA